MVKIIEGDYFKNITILKKTEKRNRKSIVWKCKCDCGVEFYRDSASISKSAKNNSIQSCGCFKEKNIKGLRFGKLTAIDQLFKVDDKGYMWEFKCDCGNTVEKIGSVVSRKEGALHCGCQELRGGNNKNDLTGEIFGKLLVRKLKKTNSANQTIWECTCTCGNTIDVKGYYLRRGKVDCGCSLRPKENTVFSGVGELYKSHFTSIYRNAKNRNIPFDITIEECYNLYIEQNKKCNLSGVDIKLGKNGDRTASLDRIDSTLGYTIDNIHWVHKDINTMKWNLNVSDFLKYCRKVYEHTKYRS